MSVYHLILFKANIVCKQLGYVGAVSATRESFFGNVSSDFSFDDVKCVGEEATLSECRHSDVSDCDVFEAAGVVCMSGDVISLNDVFDAVSSNNRDQ